MGIRLDIDGHAELTAQLVDSVLRELAALGNQNDYRIGRWLVAGYELQVERLYGFASFREYSARVLGIGSRALDDRVRTGRQLENLPKLSASCRKGEMLYAVARELSRVAVEPTEDAWMAATEGMISREVQKMVSGRTRGDLPTTRKKPEAERHDIVLRGVDPHARALFEEARRVLTKSRGEALTNTDLVSVLAQAVLAQAVLEKNESEAAELDGNTTIPQRDAGRAPYQIALRICERCRGAEWEAGGRGVVATELDVEVASCDAQELGRVDVPLHEMTRATQTIPPKIRRAVEHRHGQCCAVPGCTLSNFTHIHHVDLRSEGGTHDPERLVLLCERHHRVVHEGKLVIRGTYTQGFAFEHADGAAYGSPHARAEVASLLSATFESLTTMGYRQKEATAMVDRVRARACTPKTLSEAMKLALREAPALRTWGVREEVAVYRRIVPSPVPRRGRVRQGTRIRDRAARTSGRESDRVGGFATHFGHATRTSATPTSVAHVRRETPRPLYEKATRRSVPQPVQRKRAKPWARMRSIKDAPVLRPLRSRRSRGRNTALRPARRRTRCSGTRRCGSPTRRTPGRRWWRCSRSPSRLFVNPARVADSR